MERLLCTVSSNMHEGCCDRSDLQFILASLGWDVEIGEVNRWTRESAVVSVNDGGRFTSNINLGPVLAMTHEEAVAFVAASEWGKALEYLDYDGD